MSAHRAERVDDLVERGVPEAEARKQAAREFGNLTMHAERSREVWIAPFVTGAWQDARYALRALRRQPVFSLTAIAVLALAIGLLTAFFTVLNATLLKPWPVRDPGSIVVVRPLPAKGQQYGLLSAPEYRYLREHATTFSQLASNIYGGSPISTDTGIAIANVQSNYVTANYFDALGVGMTLGRGFLPDEEDYRSPKFVAVISERLWRESFNSDPQIAGRAIRVRNYPFTVVGVAEAGFADVRNLRVDLWMPLPAVAGVLAAPNGVVKDALVAASLAQFHDPRAGGNGVFDRLRPGVTPDQARAELDLLSGQFRSAIPMESPGVRLHDTRPLSSSSGQAAANLPTLGLVFTALFLVMLLACANVGNLLLARGMARQREIAVRLSLGAGRARVTRQLLTESLLLSLIAGIVGTLLAITVPPLLVRMNEVTRVMRSRPDYLSADTLVLVFAVLMSALACLLAGLAPALQCTRPNLATTAGDRHAGRAASHRLRGPLLAIQIALTTVLLVGAGLLTRAIGHAASQDVGFAIGEVRAVALVAPDGTPVDPFHRLRGDLEAADLPPLAVSQFPPITTARMDIGVRLPDQGPEMTRRVLLRQVSANYFDVLSLPLVAGRTFVEGLDSREIVLSQSAARQFWPNDDAIGKRLIYQLASKPVQTFDVVGIARDVPVMTLNQTEPVLYKTTGWFQTILVRDLAPTVPARVRAVVQDAVPGVVVSDRLLTDDVRKALGDLIAGSRMAWAIGALALALATTGAFGVFAYQVEERRREIGVRMALGARAPEVVKLVLRGASRPVIAGLALGLLLSFAGGPLLRRSLYGLSPFDPIAYLEIAALLTFAALAATWIPARRATRTDPAIVLRNE